MTPDASSELHSSAPERITLHGRTFIRYIERHIIAEAIRTIAATINRDYGGREIVLLVILKGAMLFAADLARALNITVQLEFLRASSYGSALSSSGTVTLESNSPLEIVCGRDVIIIEDIADSGVTIRALCNRIQQFGPRSLAVAALLSKPSVHKGTIQLDYVGIEIEPVFVVGYGLDYNELGRNLPDIYRLADHD